MAAALVGVGCSNGGRPPSIAAVVEGVKIPASDTQALVDAYLQRHQTEPQAEHRPREQIAKEVLGYQIKLAVLGHLAETIGVAPEPESSFAAAADLMAPGAFDLIGERKQDFVRELRAARLSKAMAEKLYPNVDVAEGAVRAEYERRSPVLERTWKATAQVAGFDTPEPAGEVRRRVEGGELFEHAASALGAEGVATVDIDPVFTSLPADALDAIRDLPIGQVSHAIPASGGWLAVLVERRQPTPKPTFEDLRPELTNLLAERRRYELFGEWFAQRFAEAKVTVDRHYGRWNPGYTAVS